MPKADQHRVKSERNRKFLATISPDDYPEWAAVAAFYAAVHAAERLRAVAGDGHSTGHGDRRAYIRDMHPDIHTHFRTLETVSMLARYQSMAEFFEQFQPADIPTKIIAERLVPIEEYVRAWIQNPLPAKGRP